MILINTNTIRSPVDFSKTSLLAVKHGAFIAKICKGDIILLHVQKKDDLIDIILPIFDVKNISEITKFLEEKLEKLGKEVRKEYGIKVIPLVSTGNITSEIVNIAEEYKAGIIIMGTQGANSNNDLFLGSNSYKVLTKSTIPVMTVRTESPKIGYRNILLPIDSSEHSRQKVNAAIQIANKFASHLYVVGVLGEHEDAYKYKMEIILSQIKKMVSSKKLVCTTQIIKTNNRSKKTLSYAKKVKADLIITMTDQKTELSRAILSTYVHELINNAKIPVLSIPPETHYENLGQDSIGGMW